jgi:hypothetical protein
MKIRKQESYAMTVVEITDKELGEILADRLNEDAVLKGLPKWRRRVDPNVARVTYIQLLNEKDFKFFIREDR